MTDFRLKSVIRVWSHESVVFNSKNDHQKPSLYGICADEDRSLSLSMTLASMPLCSAPTLGIVLLFHCVRDILLGRMVSFRWRGMICVGGTRVALVAFTVECVQH